MTAGPMALALVQAQKGALLGEVPIGAVLVEGASGQILFEGHNLVETTNDPTAHAELLAIRAGCASLQTPLLSTCDLYVTLEPCPMCAQALSFARIRRLIFGAFNPKGGGVDHGPRVLDPSFGTHRPEIVGGLEERACQALLKDFFGKLRSPEN